MTVTIGVALVAVLLLLILWFAVPEWGPKLITAAAYCLAVVWLALQLFVRVR